MKAQTRIVNTKKRKHDKNVMKRELTLIDSSSRGQWLYNCLIQSLLHNVPSSSKDICWMDRWKQDHIGSTILIPDWMWGYDVIQRSWLVDQIDACPFYQVNMEEYQAWRWVLEVEIIQFKTYWIWGLYNSLKEPSMLELRRVVCAINRVALYLTEMVEPA